MDAPESEGSTREHQPDHLPDSGLSRRMFLRRIALAGGGASALALLAACGGTPPAAPAPTVAPAAPEPTAAPAPTTAAPAAATAAPAPTTAPAAATGGRIIFGYGAEAVTLDGAAAIDGPSFDVIYNIHDGLLEVNERGEIVPALAESYTVSEDQLTWTFTLRSGVTFHDGTPFDAEAVKFNFDRVLDPANELGNLKQWEPFIAEVRVVDPLTVAVQTKEPYGSFLSKLAGSFGKFMNSPTAVQQAGADYGRNPVGTGPFAFESWTVGERITLVRNPGYWREGPLIEAIEFRPVAEGSARVLGLEGGDLDIISQVPAQNLQVLAQNDQLAVANKTILRLFYWAFNHAKPIWRDPNVRIAFNHAIDRESIVANVLFGVGEVANSYVSPSVAGSIPIDGYDYNPEKARSMLEAAGFPFDQELVCYVTEGRYYQDRQVAEAVQGMLAEIGVQIKVEVLEWGAFVDAIWSSPVDSPVAQARDLMQTSFGGDDPPTWMKQTLASDMWPTNGFNEAFYKNERVDALIAEVNQATDLTRRGELLGEIQRELINDPPWMISHFEQAVIAHKATLSGAIILPTGQVDFRLAQLA